VEDPVARLVDRIDVLADHDACVCVCVCSPRIRAQFGTQEHTTWARGRAIWYRPPGHNTS
jgi:hypothetical protein